MKPPDPPSPVVFLPDRRRARGLGRIAPLVAAPLLLVLAGAAADKAPAVALVNETPSLPRGLYLRTPRVEPVRGDIVAAPQPPAARPYLAALGVPPDMPLLKRIAAQPGDHVCSDGRALIAGFHNARMRPRDRLGRPLPVWRGCRRLGPDELFLLGDSPGSYDSRYFGPVRRARIIGVYRAVLTW